MRYKAGLTGNETLQSSMANAEVDDQTVRRCIRFAQREGYGGLEVLNLYAYVATDPELLRRVGYLVGKRSTTSIALPRALERDLSHPGLGVVAHAGRKDLV
jgi:hypothetical protein